MWRPTRPTARAVIQPISRAIMGLLPALPQLGHGAYLTDLYTIRDAPAGDPAAWSAIFGSAVSVVAYPLDFVRDWVAVIDAVLDHRDPDLGFIAAPTVPAAPSVDDVQAPADAVSAPGGHRAPDGSASVGAAAGVPIAGPGWNGPETSDHDQGAEDPGPDTVETTGPVTDQNPAVPATPSSPAPAGTATTPVGLSADLAAAW